MRRILIAAAFLALLLLAGAVARVTLSAYGIGPAPGWIADGTDAHGDPLPAGAVARLGTVRFRSTTETNLVWLADGRIAAGGFDQEIVLWDAETGERTQVLPGHRATLVEPAEHWSWYDARHALVYGRPPIRLDHVAWLGLTEHGARLISAGRTVRAWDLATGEGRLVAFPRYALQDPVLVGDAGWLSERTGYVVRDVDLATGEETTTRPFSATDGLGVSIGASSARLLHVFQDNDSSLGLADISRGEVATLAGPHAGVMPRTACFSPDDGTVWCVWNRHGRPDDVEERHSLLTAIDVERREETASTALDDSGQWCRVACSPDGSTLALCTIEGRVEVRDAATLALRRVIDATPRGVLALSFAPDSRRLALNVGGCTLSIADVATGERHVVPDAHEGAVGAVTFLDDERVLTSGYDGVLRAWEARTGHVLWERRGAGLAFPAAAPSDGTIRVATADAVLSLRCDDGRSLGSRAVPDGWIVFATAPDGRLLLRDDPRLAGRPGSGDDDRVARLDVGAGEPRVIDASPRDAHDEDRRQEHEAVAWDAAGERVLLEITDQRVTSRERTPDGYVRSSWVGTPSLRLIDARDGHTLWSSDARAVPAVAAFAGERVVVALSGDAVVLDARGEELRVLEAPPDAVRTAGSPGHVSSIQVAPDGTRVATAGPDLAVRVWSLRTGALMHTFRGHGAAVVALAWSPDGTLLASGSSDSTALVWDVAD